MSLRPGDPVCLECDDSGWLIETWYEREAAFTPIPPWVLANMPERRREALLAAHDNDPAQIPLWKHGKGIPRSQARRCVCVLARGKVT